MSSTATLTSIPTELRLIIIEIIAGKTKKRPRIPCCKEHDPQSEDWRWVRGPDEDRVILGAVRSVLALMQVNKRLYQDVRSIFFPGVSVAFCAGYPMLEYSPALHGLGASYSASQMSIAQRNKFMHSLHNFEAGTFMRNFHSAATHNDYVYLYGDSPVAKILSKYDVIESHVLFVEALNKSRDVVRLEVCCNFMHPNQLSPATALEDILGAFERLDPSIKLDIHLHALNKYPFEFPLPHRRFPSQGHKSYIERLQGQNRGRPVNRPDRLTEEWRIFRNWLIKASKGVISRYKRDPDSDLLHLPEADTNIFSDSKFDGTSIMAKVPSLVMDAYQHHVSGRKFEFDQCKAQVCALWIQHCDDLHYSMDARFTEEKWMLEGLYNPAWGLRLPRLRTVLPEVHEGCFSERMR